MRTINLTLEYAKGRLSFDDSPLNHSFLAKNDISEIIAERDIIKLKPRSVYSLLKKLKASKVCHKYVTVEMDQFKIQWSKPPEFQSDSYLYEKISQLDEAD